jgi:molybdopterin-guanine dinucleotide biosynthesis protein A
MSNIKSHIVSKSDSLRLLLSRLEQVKEKVLFVVDERERLVGSITDGDIRRALFKYHQESSALEICNQEPTYISESGEYVNLKNNKLDLIPVVNSDLQITALETVNQGTCPIKTMVIMAGGKGRRLGKLTKKVPKPMVLIKNKPMLEHIIDTATRQGVKNFIICVNHLKEKIIDYFQDGQELGVNIVYVEEEKKLDTAGALSLINVANLPENFFVKNCDVFEQVNYHNFALSHLNENRAATALAIPYRHTIWCARKSRYETFINLRKTRI